MTKMKKNIMLLAKTTFVVASLPAWLFVRGLSRVIPRGGAACIACSPLCGILLSDTLNHMPCVPPLSSTHIPNKHYTCNIPKYHDFFLYSIFNLYALLVSSCQFASHARRASLIRGRYATELFRLS